MKKVFQTLILALAPVLFLTSCSDDDKDLPDVDFGYTLENAVYYDGSIYVAQGEEFAVTAITVTNREEGKGALITAATYYWDNFRLGTTIEPPYGFDIEVGDTTPLGDHTLSIECPLYAVDKELAISVVGINVKVVASADEFPAEGSTSFGVVPTTTTPDK